MADNEMTTQELYVHILKNMTAEEALMKLIEGMTMKYNFLKFKSQEESVHPELIIVMAAMELGWTIGVCDQEDPESEVRGLIMGKRDYVSEVLAKMGYEIKYDKIKKPEEIRGLKLCGEDCDCCTCHGDKSISMDQEQESIDAFLNRPVRIDSNDDMNEHCCNGCGDDLNDSNDPKDQIDPRSGDHGYPKEFRHAKNNEEKQLQVGDCVNIAGLHTVVEDICELQGLTMVCTPYGDFNISLVEQYYSKDEI
jgi:hypothetical protein